VGRGAGHGGGGAPLLSNARATPVSESGIPHWQCDFAVWGSLGSQRGCGVRVFTNNHRLNIEICARHLPSLPPYSGTLTRAHVASGLRPDSAAGPIWTFSARRKLDATGVRVGGPPCTGVRHCPNSKSQRGCVISDFRTGVTDKKRQGGPPTMPSQGGHLFWQICAYYPGFTGAPAQKNGFPALYARYLA